MSKNSTKILSYDASELRQVNWQQVFSVHSASGGARGPAQAAEFLVHGRSEDRRVSVALSAAYITRIIVPSRAAFDAVPDEAPQTQILELFAPIDRLLQAEKLFTYRVRTFCERNGVDYEHIVISILELLRIEHCVGDRMHTLYGDQVISAGVHGLNHTVRVCFWAAFLALLETEPRSSLVTAVMVAALVHDTARNDDAANLDHGDAAVQRHRPFINEMLPDLAMQDACIEAIRLHSRDDTHVTNRVLRILKDADALERGRFQNPTHPDGCPERFSQIAFLEERPR